MAVLPAYAPNSRRPRRRPTSRDQKPSKINSLQRSLRRNLLLLKITSALNSKPRTLKNQAPCNCQEHLRSKSSTLNQNIFPKFRCPQNSPYKQGPKRDPSLENYPCGGSCHVATPQSPKNRSYSLNFVY